MKNLNIRDPFSETQVFSVVWSDYSRPLLGLRLRSIYAGNYTSSLNTNTYKEVTSLHSPVQQSPHEAQIHVTRAQLVHTDTVICVSVTRVCRAFLK